MNVKKNFHQTNDYLFVKDFEVACKVGTTPEERAFPQVVSLSLKIFLPLFKAGQTDELKESVDYAEIIRKIRVLLQANEFQLVETLAEKVTAQILEEKKILAVEIKIEKKIFPGIGSVGACIFRSQTKNRLP